MLFFDEILELVMQSKIGCKGQSFDLEHKCLEVVYCVIHTINIHLYIRKSSI